MNDKKVAFIICVNDEIYYSECAWYINNLNVPLGYEIDIICITGVESMAQGYNAAMESSDAKYKVYLHQDTFIYNKNFIQDIVKIFMENENLGLLGVLGGTILPKDAVVFTSWNIGKAYICDNKRNLWLEGNQDFEGSWAEVKAVDGMILITQYDIRWREDLDLGWHFYDVTQALEFTRKGYKVGVPYQESPSCMHDCGYPSLRGYDAARKKVMAEYKEVFSAECVPCYDEKIYSLQEEIFQQMKQAIEQKKFERALQIKALIDETGIQHNDLQYAFNLLEIYEKECKCKVQCLSFFEGVDSWEKLKTKYIILKFAVCHLYNKTNLEQVSELIDMVKQGVISREAVTCIAQRSVASL